MLATEKLLFMAAVPMYSIPHAWTLVCGRAVTQQQHSNKHES
jgi:hypothetical protein